MRMHGGRAPSAVLLMCAILSSGFGLWSAPPGAAEPVTNAVGSPVRAPDRAPDRSASAEVTRHGPVGWDTYRHPERLGEIGGDSRTRQFSSFDRNGGNDDGFSGTYSCLSSTDAGCLLAQHLGAGEIDSIWFTRDDGDVTNTGRIRIELDGKAVVDAKLQDVVDGKLGAPFVHPLVANADQSSGGVQIKVPMPYRESMRVYTEHNPLFFHVTYRQFADATGIATFDPSDPATDVITKLRASGTQDPKPDYPNEVVSRTEIKIAAGKSAVLATATGPGALTELSIRLPQLLAAPTADMTGAPTKVPSPIRGKERWVRQLRERATKGIAASSTEDILQNARLRVSFDGKRTVDAPLGEFFGSGLGLYPVRSLMFAMDPGSKTLSSWWLMPFARSAKVELYNGSGVDISGGEAVVTSAPIANMATELSAGGLGYFQATAVKHDAVYTRDHVFLETNGRGRVVGVTQTVIGSSAGNWRRGYLEGDERVFVDGSNSPDLHGTGTEDFYEGGWYFNRGSFSAPFTGAPVADREDCPAACTGMYRLLLAEGVDFGNHVRFGIEHGQGNDEPATEASTTYWYGLSSGQLAWTDSLDVGDVASERTHAYRSTAPGDVTRLVSRFEGIDGPPEPVSLDGRATSAAVQFKLAVAANNQGVVLRRTSDQNNGFQSAGVLVDDRPVGTWNQPLAN